MEVGEPGQERVLSSRAIADTPALHPGSMFLSSRSLLAAYTPVILATLGVCTECGSTGLASLRVACSCLQALARLSPLCEAFSLRSPRGASCYASFRTQLRFHLPSAQNTLVRHPFTRPFT